MLQKYLWSSVFLYLYGVCTIVRQERRYYVDHDVILPCTFPMISRLSEHLSDRLLVLAQDINTQEMCKSSTFLFLFDIFKCFSVKKDCHHTLQYLQYHSHINLRRGLKQGSFQNNISCFLLLFTVYVLSFCQANVWLYVSFSIVVHWLRFWCMSCVIFVVSCFIGSINVSEVDSVMSRVEWVLERMEVSQVFGLLLNVILWL